MRDLKWDEFYLQALKFFEYYLDHWYIWFFYVLSYFAVLFYTNRALAKLNTKVEDNYTGKSKLKLLYLSIKSMLRELRDSEGKIFYGFIVAIIFINVRSSLEGITELEEISFDTKNMMKFYDVCLLILYHGLIYVLPNYLRFVTFRKLNKTFL
ncbi:hypothetical protein [Roseivirga pacifica]|uniref:hypothetical protein n=1 Tax=Roseivirga pacifica TaxID=1267423 RepID=UPI003BA8BD34